MNLLNFYVPIWDVIPILKFIYYRNEFRTFKNTLNKLIGNIEQNLCEKKNRSYNLKTFMINQRDDLLKKGKFDKKCLTDANISRLCHEIHNGFVETSSKTLAWLLLYMLSDENKAKLLFKTSKL